MKSLFFISFFILLSFSAYSLPNKPLPQEWIPEDQINSIAQGPDGMTYIGGYFSRIGSYSGSAVPLNLAEKAPPLQFPKVNGPVSTIISDGKEGWYIGGRFSKVGEVGIQNLAHLFSNYSVDLKWQPNPDGAVKILGLSEDKKTLYIAGDFQNIFDTNLKLESIQRLARFDNDSGKLDSNWKPNPDGSVNALVSGKETLYIGGEFKTIFDKNGNRQFIQCLAKFSSGDLDTNWKPNPEYNMGQPTIKSLSLNKDILYVASTFISKIYEKGMSYEIKREGLIRFNKDVFDDKWDPGLKDIRTLAMNGETLYVGGDGYLVRIDGGVLNLNWKPMFDNRGANEGMKKSSVLTIIVKDETLYVGGSFDVVHDPKLGRQPMTRLVKFEKEILDPDWKPLNTDSLVAALALNGETLYVGGSFDTISGEPIERLARLNKEGVLDSNWKPNPDDVVNVLGFEGETLYVGGNFMRIGGQEIRGLARFDNKGALDIGWKPNPDGEVTSLVMSGDIFYMGGHFEMKVFDQNQTERSIISLAKFNKGILDTSWRPNPIYIETKKDEKGNEIKKELPGSIYALAANNENLYIAGYFEKISNKEEVKQPISYLARFKNETLTDWKPTLKIIDEKGQEMAPYITALAADKEHLYVGGRFDKIDQENIRDLARFNLNSNNQTFFDSGWKPNPIKEKGVPTWVPAVQALILEGETLYVGGKFMQIERSLIRNLAQFHQGILNTGWHPDLNYGVSTLFLSNQALFAGGFISESGDYSSGRFSQFQSLIHFSQTEIKESRKIGEVNLEIELSEPDPSEVTVDYVVTGGTAKQGVDYRLINGTLTILPGETRGIIPLTILDNPKETEDKTIEISLSNPTGVFLGENKKLTYTIKKSFMAVKNSSENENPKLSPFSESGGCALVQFGSPLTLTLSPSREEGIWYGYLLFLISLSFLFLRRESLKN